MVAKVGTSLRWGGALALIVGCGSEGRPPIVAAVDEQIAVVGQELVVTLQASDPDGDALGYDFSSLSLPDLSQTAALTVAPDGTALFRWLPIASQLGTHTVDFSVSDAEHEIYLPVRFEVRGAAGAGSAPIFREPLGSGEVLDLAKSSCVDVVIEVEDPDSSEVALTERSGPEGATLQVSADGLDGAWRWCPSAAQRSQAGHYELELSADDGDNPPTIKSYTLIIRRSSEDCPTQLPTLEHAPADLETLFDPEIVVVASDDLALYSAPILRYADQPPGDDDLDALSYLFMEQIAGDGQVGTFRATLPNPAVPQGAGSTASIYYVISVGDEDSCYVDSPAQGLHEVRVTNPGGPGGPLCRACSWDAQCGEAGDLCLQLGVDQRACGSACTGDQDCDDGFACSAVELTSVEGATGRQCVPTVGGCEQSCEDDDSEPNDSLAQALEDEPLPEGLLSARRLCPLDDDWYHVRIEAAARINALLSAASVPDLDLSLHEAGGQIIDASSGPESEESIISGCLAPGSYLLHAFTLFEAEASYQLSYVLDANGC